MITTNERREIAASIGEIDWAGCVNKTCWCAVNRLCEAMGLEMRNTYVEDVIAIAAKVRELCDASEPLSGTDGEEALAATISAHVKRAVREGDAETAIDAISRAVDEELGRQREQARHDMEQNGATFVDLLTDEGFADHGLMRLPIGADGEAIMPGQVVTDRAHKRWVVIGVRPGDSYPIVVVREGDCVASGTFGRLSTNDCLHAHDTATSIAEEMDEYADEYVCGQPRDLIEDKLHDLADRLRALGEED